MEARFLLGAIRRSLVLILLLGIVGLAIGTWIGISSPVKYQTAASIEVYPPNVAVFNGSQATQDPSAYVQTQIGVITGNTVLGNVARAVRMDRLQVAKAISVTQRQTSDIIDIAATTGAADRAQALANQVVNTYIQQLNVSINLEIGQIRSSLEDRLNALQVQLTTTTSPAQINYIQNQVGPVAQELANLDAVSPSALSGTKIIGSANLPSSPLPRHTTIKAALGLLGGLALGLIVSVLIAAIRPRMIRSEDVESAIGITTAAELPHVSEWHGADRSVGPGAGGWKNNLDWKDHPGFAVEVAKIAVFVEAARSARNCKTVLVTSLESSAGVSTLSAALAAALRDGNRVVRLVGLSGLEEAAADEEESAGRFGVVRSDRPAASGDPSWPGYSLPGRMTGPSSPVRAEGSSPRRERKFQLSDDDFDADVLVLDGGSLSVTASVVSVARSSDVTVLVVPLPNEHERYLHAFTRATFSDARGQLVIVTNQVAPTRSRRRVSRG